MNDAKRDTNRSPFWRGPAPSGSMNSCRQVVHTIPDVAYPFVYLLLAWSRAERPLQVLICVSKTLIDAGSQGTNAANLFLIGKATEILGIRVPRNEVCIPRAQFWILLVVRGLSPFESKTSIDSECLIVEIPGVDIVSNESKHTVMSHTRDLSQPSASWTVD